MAGVIKVLSNQSMVDVIIQACGSMEAGMVFCRDNGVSISDIPTVGTEYVVSDAALALGDRAVLVYLAQNDVVVGTLGNVAMPCPAPEVAAITGEGSVYMGEFILLSCATPGGVWSSSDDEVAMVNSAGMVYGVAEGGVIISYMVTRMCGASTTVAAEVGVVAVGAFNYTLVPYMDVVYNGGGDEPNVLGRYDFKFVAGSGFVHTNPLLTSWLVDMAAGGRNYFKYQHISEMVAHLPVEVYHTPATTVMTDIQVDVPNIGYTLAEYVFIWSAGEVARSMTFEDERGSKAVCSPVVIMNPVLAGIYMVWLGDIDVTLVSSDGIYVTLRLTRNSTGAASGIQQAMEWMYDACGGVPDPGDPGNPDTTLVTVPRGRYQMGVRVTYTLLAVPITYPSKSVFSKAVIVY